MTDNLPAVLNSDGGRTNLGHPQGARRGKAILKPSPIRVLDLFAGGGGSTCGALVAGVQVVAAVDAWELARQAYLDNFPGVVFYRQKCQYLDPRRVGREVGPIHLLIASPECTSHSCAKGAASRSESSRKTANQVIRFARALQPRWIVVENVIYMRNWTGYPRWYRRLAALGYHIRTQVLDSAHFGVPQSRKRLFVMCDREAMPPKVIPQTAEAPLPARQVVNMNGAYRYSLLRTPARAAPTLERADRAIAALGPGAEFLLVYYSRDGAGGWQRLDVPLRTITTVDRFAYVRQNGCGRYDMRMLQVPELQKAMGFPDTFKLRNGSRRERIKLLGNAVCPPVMEAAVRTLVGCAAACAHLERTRNG